MPKIPTAGMTWTVSREKHPDSVLRIKWQSGYYSESAPAIDMNSTRTMNSIRNLLQYPNPEKQGDKLL